MAIFSGDSIVLNRQGNQILKDLCFSFPAGEIITLVGPSGAGKSTLLNLLNRLIDPDQGKVFYRGRDIREYNVQELRRDVGLVMQQPVLFPGTVKENILYGPSQAGKVQPELAQVYLELVGLPISYLENKVDNLSGGEKQRVSLARTLANFPQTLLLDEPTAALDPAATEHIEKVILNLRESKELTVIWVTHSLQQARRVGTRTMMMAAGKIAEDKPTEEFFDNPAEHLTRQFIAGERLAGRDRE